MPRPKGSRNRPKRRLLQLLQESYPDYHPVLEMAKTANDDSVDANTRFQANKEVAKYVEPALKATEITGEDGGPIVLERPSVPEISKEEWLEAHGLGTAAGTAV